MKVFKELAPKLLENGYEPIPITPGTKICYEKNWASIKLDQDQIETWCKNGLAGHNVGLRTGRLIGIDLDLDDEKLCQEMQILLKIQFGKTPIRFSKKGRLLILYRTENLGKKLRVELEKPNGQIAAIDVLQLGQQLVAFGKHPSGIDYRWGNFDLLETKMERIPYLSKMSLNYWVNNLKNSIPKNWKIVKHAIPEKTFDDSERFLANYKHKTVLESMTPKDRANYEGMKTFKWVPKLFGEKVCRKVKSGYRISSKDLNRDLQEDLSFHPDGIRDFGHRKGHTPVSVVQEFITKDEDKAIDVLLNTLGIQLTFHEPILSTEVKKSSTELREFDDSVFKLFEGWFYVLGEDHFYQPEKNRFVTRQGFEALFRKPLKKLLKDKVSAVPFALHEVNIPKVDHIAFNPKESRVYEYRDKIFVNRFCKKHLPKGKPLQNFTSEDHKAVKLVKNHIHFICNGNENVLQTLTHWLAHNVQHPGEKIAFAPLIKGVEGDGKTTFMILLSKCLGSSHVSTIGPKDAAGAYNGFAEGHCVVALEELRIMGHNRYDALNALKPLITNDEITINEKFKALHNVPNCTNYIAFTNYVDALPLTDTDRRWFLIFTPWNSLQEMAETTGKDHSVYFKDLYKALNQHSQAIISWFRSLDLSTFDRHSRAPETTAKKIMFDANLDDDTELIQNIVDDKQRFGVGENIILGTVFQNPEIQKNGLFLVKEDQPRLPSGKKLKRILNGLGWYRRKAPMNIDTKLFKVWVNGTKYLENPKSFYKAAKQFRETEKEKLLQKNDDKIAEISDFEKND